MVGVRYTGDSLYSRRDGPTWTPEDDVHDVAAGLAEQLVRRDRFEYADEAQGESEDAESADSGEGSDDATDATDDGDAAGTCAATTADGTPCENSAGEDGYCHIASHGPEG